MRAPDGTPERRRQPSRLSTRSSAGSESRQIAGLCTDRGVFREARLLVRRDQELERRREVVVREPGCVSADQGVHHLGRGEAWYRSTVCGDGMDKGLACPHSPAKPGAAPGSHGGAMTGLVSSSEPRNARRMPANDTSALSLWNTRYLGTARATRGTRSRRRGDDDVPIRVKSCRARHKLPGVASSSQSESCE